MPRIAASLLIALFVNFVFADTLFIHTHRDSLGHQITHSHPYCPQSGHSHSSQSLDQIAAFNLAAACMKATFEESLDREDVTTTTIITEVKISQFSRADIPFSMRAPPSF